MRESLIRPCNRKIICCCVRTHAVEMFWIIIKQITRFDTRDYRRLLCIWDSLCVCFEYHGKNFCCLLWFGVWVDHDGRQLFWVRVLKSHFSYLKTTVLSSVIVDSTLCWESVEVIVEVTLQSYWGNVREYHLLQWRVDGKILWQKVI